MTLATPTSRAVAFALLRAVLRKKQSLDDSMDTVAGFDLLEKRDRAFVHRLVACVLRRLGQIDEAIKVCLDKPQELKADAQDVLRLGAAQLLFLGTPPHAAVDTTVDLSASLETVLPYKGLVNAVMRRLAREEKFILAKQDAARLTTPDWLWLSWRTTYGVARARAIAEAQMCEAPIDITVKMTPEAWAKKLEARLLPTGSLRLSEAIVPELPGFKEGGWWVQDAASALPVKLFGDIKGRPVVDLCAAPGGKTLQLASAGAIVLAVDRSAKRLERLRENLVRCRLGANVVERDVLEFLPEKKAELVLLDAPCTATGTLRRHPDILRLKDKDDLRRMVDLQRRLLEHVVQKVLAPRGLLVYSVCSLQPEEGEEQIEKLLQNFSTLKRVPVKPEEVGGCAEFITRDGDVRCLPSHWPDWGGLDGFYAARLMF
jgi:16S rRNA (cytosine967-C5)-methyltransferase